MVLAAELSCARAYLPAGGDSALFAVRTVAGAVRRGRERSGLELCFHASAPVVFRARFRRRHVARHLLRGGDYRRSVHRANPGGRETGTLARTAVDGVISSHP